MPLAAMVPKSAIPAPPRTAVGTTATKAPSTGTRPSTMRMPPPAATTQRLRMPVMATRPTFWAKALSGYAVGRGRGQLPR